MRKKKASYRASYAATIRTAIITALGSRTSTFEIEHVKKMARRKTVLIYILPLHTAAPLNLINFNIYF